MSARAQDWQQKLYTLLPLARAMSVRVSELADGRLVLTASLAPNVNDKGTGFGGSIAALGITAGWCAVMEVAGRHGLPADVVIQRSHTEYLAPATADFSAMALASDDAARERFLETLKRRGRARLRVGAEITAGDTVVARVEGDYVAALKSF